MTWSFRRLIHRTGALLAAAMLLALCASSAAQAATPSVDIHSAGPLSDIWIGNDLSCQVAHTGDSSTEYFPGASDLGDCGTFLFVNGATVGSQLFGPDFGSHAAGTATSFPNGEMPFTAQAGNQSFTGSGTAASPYRVATAVSGTDGSLVLSITEVDTYIVGNDYYQTDITVTNNSSITTFDGGKLYHAADCFLRGFDTGFGALEPSPTTAACTINANNSPASALEEFVPLTARNNWVETSFPTIWSDIGSELPNTCACTTNEDNAEGINWDVGTLRPDQSSPTFSMHTKIDDPAIAATGGQTFSGRAAATVGGTVATISDSDLATSGSDYTATVNWGDGSTPDQNATISGSNGTFTVSDSHTYSAAGSYQITVTVSYATNSANSATATDLANITSAPASVSTGRPSVKSSTGAAFSGSVNPGGLATSAHFEYGLDPKYSGGGPIVYDQSTPNQQVGSDFADHTLSASVSGLVPNALYHVRLVASNSAGTVRGPDVTFMTKKDPPPPPPTLGKTFNVTLVSGLVFIKLPSSGHAADRFSSNALIKGAGFIPLTEARQLPTGSEVDARHGSLKLVTATGRRNKTQNGTFSTGLFKLGQTRTGVNKGLATLTLLEGAFPGAPSFSVCKVHGVRAGAGGPDAQAARLSRQILQTLHARESHGRFRTRGRYSAGTVLGTKWDTVDRCDGTLTVVHRGTVLVHDFHRRKTIKVHAGHRYLAKAILSRRHK
jgi:hypothetical protein